MTLQHNAKYREAQMRLSEAERNERREQERERRRGLETNIDFQIIDADQHYYEPDDCFTRHVEQKYRSQAIEVWRDQPDGRGRLYRSGKRFRRYSGPMGEATDHPGTLREYFKSQAREDRLSRGNVRAIEFPEFVSREPRLGVLDDHNIEAAIVLPTLGVVVEDECTIDMEADAWYALVRSFNRWVEEDWGYGTDGRIFGVPLVSLFDPEQAVAELDRLIACGVKVVLLRAGPAYGRSPADPVFDPFWSRVQEANVVVAFHIGEFGYLDFFATEWGYGRDHSHVGNGHPFETLTCSPERVISDTIAALIFGRLFDRFPSLQFIIIELGASWLPELLKKMDYVWRRPNRLNERLDEAPSDIYRRHFWISPYYEDPWEDIIASVGIPRVVFGSDYPHPEGLADPLDILEDISVESPQDLKTVLRDNAASLLGLSSASP